MLDLLKEFQKEDNRLLEESFSQILTERNDLRLFFINEDKCFTDGKNIIIDPAFSGLFQDIPTLEKVEEFLNISDEISSNPFITLKMCARAPNIHECLHIIYSNFPGGCVSDERGTTNIRKKVLAYISNIIEDAFIEAAGCSEFDNLEHFLLWFRVGIGFAGHQERTIVLDDPLASFLNYMCKFLLYSFIEQFKPGIDIVEYVEKTKQLFLDGAVCGDPDERYTYTQKIFDIIEPLIPKQETDTTALDKLMEELLVGTKTHSGESSTIASFSNKGKTAVITRRLFNDEEAAGSQLLTDREEIQKKFNQEIKRINDEAGDFEIHLIVSNVYKPCSEYDCSNIHKGIKIEISRAKINLNLKKAYQNIVNKYRLNINSHSNRFSQLLKGMVDEIEDRRYFGTGIMSKKLIDIKKRYWFRKIQSENVPNIGFLFLIDGSGSMGGERLKGAMETSIILHEVLHANNIMHSIVEHRAIYGEPLLEHNIMVSFSGRKEEKFNLLGLEANEGTREGLTLYWAEKYLQDECDAEKKMIIMISDGAPMHHYEDDNGNTKEYCPPISIKDTALAVKKITKRGTGIVAIALSTPGEDDCYGQLKTIYKDVVACTDMGTLTGQLLGVVSKCLRKM
ncbi:MAG: hypothetical protein FWH35_00240 [Treponema sp.]|nr:hypothetical protein [Treponema sp.]